MKVLDIEPPTRAQMAQLLERYAPLRPVPLCPELRAHYAHSLIEVWEAAERLAGRPLPAPFWAYPWAGGIALARVLLDQPQLTRGKRVLARARCAGAEVIIADAGRTYFDPAGMELLAEFLVPVPPDLEGEPLRRARVYRFNG